MKTQGEAVASKCKGLTLREKTFLRHLFACGLDASKAYRAMMAETGKTCAEGTIASAACRMRQRIAASSEFAAILAERGIDKISLAEDLNRLRELKAPVVSDGVVVGMYDDGKTQLGAAKMIGDALGVLTPNAASAIPVVITIGEPPKPEETAPSA